MNDSTLSKNHDLALLLLRIGVALVFVVAGWGKLNGIEGVQGFFGDLGIPMAGIMAWVVALTEFVGGLMVLFGVKARIPNLLLAFIMVVAIFTTKLGDFDISSAGVRVDLLMLITTLSLALMGSGRFSVDAMFLNKSED
ncbi:DoxX family protein [Rhodohalobacter barkolensis]|uniref:DoxX family protein n=1 Tax=Rhodohalobacter barkolensis TaxID=2053187 RepID=A0A2N0VLE4_9BACT|nr:DoxX family protein [Rhodohalobacter barkolensis]PKD44996.1 DoxX family protein [Rhodohalobacter barkolensis]